MMTHHVELPYDADHHTLMNRPAIERVAVVIPARDEVERIDICLQSVSIAAAEVGPVAVRVFVVADGCVDDTVSHVARHPNVTVLETDGVGVGAARRLGAAFAIARGVQWIGNTDADSVVPSDWLVTQLEMARQGVDVVVGTVRPDFSELSDLQRHAWTLTHDRGQALGHVHGANLGIRVSAYLLGGGFSPVPEHEDVDLVNRLRGRAEVVATARGEVMTSGRSVGRTVGGYARFLRDDLVRSANQNLAHAAVQVDSLS